MHALDPRQPKTSTGANAVPALSIKDVTVRYGNVTAVRDVTFDVPPKSITALIGRSGCGKTSLLCGLNRLTDLIEDCQVAGQVLLEDQNVLDPATDVVQLRRKFGMIFQRPNPFPFSIRRNLALPLTEHGVRDKREIAERSEQALREVGLWQEVAERLDAPALALSGGQQQRLCLARALVLRPEVILLDEPCSSLDPLATQVVEDLMLRLREHYTLVVVTHNLGQAQRVADRVAFLWSDGDGGRLVEAGPTGQIFQCPRESLTAEYVAGRVG